MGYLTSFSGEIRIDPPLSWGEVKGSPWLSARYGDVMVRLVVEEVTEETDEGTSVFTRKTVDAITPANEDEPYKGYKIVTQVQNIVDAYPDRTYSGYISAGGENAGDLWRLAVKNGRAVKVEPRIVWPDEDGTS